MENIISTIRNKKLINAGEIIGVGCSGGSDSMALLHYLNALSKELDIEVVAIHIDHCIRENSADDAEFVKNYCKKNSIRFYKFKIDVPKLAEKRKKSIETVARDARYDVFNALIKKDVIDKIAIAHNSQDQAETILLNLFRGTGLEGASGMDYIRNNVFIRPMLNTSKKNILNYIFLNDIPYHEDQTNKDTTYSRNYIRNTILPLIEARWKGVVDKLINFGKDCLDDNSYINSQICDDAIIYSEKIAKIPNSYFLYPNAIISRIIFNTLKKIGVQKDIERIHIKMIKDLAKNGENGSKIKLPFSVTVHKEYDYITLTNKIKKILELNKKFKSGSFDVPNFGAVTVKRTKDTTRDENELILDYKKVPKDAVWRFKARGDMFTKFGGGTKKLKDYFIDKKIPIRLRDSIPVLASGKNILVIAGVEIADSVRIDNATINVAKIIVNYKS